MPQTIHNERGKSDFDQVYNSSIGYGILQVLRKQERLEKHVFMC